MNKKLTIIFLVLLIAGRFSAQSLAPSVIASAGNYFSNSQFSLSWTLAEMTMVETFNDGSNFLTQGFQQPFANTTGVPEIPVAQVNKFNLYPNPSNGQFQVNYQLTESGQLTFRVFNLLGQKVYENSMYQSAGTNLTNFNLSTLAESLYFLETTFQSASGKQLICNQKFNIMY